MSRRASSVGTVAAAPVVPTSVLDGLEQIPITKFISLKALRETVESERNQLRQQESRSTKCMIFGPVNNEIFQRLKKSDDGFGKDTRCGYDKAKGRLVVTIFKVSQEHEAFVINLGEEIKASLLRMGHSTRALISIGCAGYESFSGSKQPDASFKPATRTSRTAPPSIVFESGFSESLPQLRQDAKWWLSNAPNEVNIVILVAIRPRNKVIIVEKWILVERTKDGRSGTASRPAPKFMLPTCTQDIRIEPQPKGSTTFVSKGGPLIFEFDKLMDRAPASLETNITLSDANLAELAADIWAALD